MRLAAAASSGLLLLLSNAGGWAAPALIQQVRIEGASNPLALETLPGRPLDALSLQHDLRRLWETGRYDDVRVEAEETPAGPKVTFRLVERLRYRLRRIRYEPVSFRPPLRPEPDTLVDHTLARRAAVSLQQSLVAGGHTQARVKSEIEPLGDGRADLLLRVTEGPSIHVEKVLFSGELGLPQREIERALRNTRSRTLRRPPYSEAAIAADVQRLQSLYTSRGYLRARVALDGVDFEGSRATVRFTADSGPRFAIEQLDTNGAGPARDFHELCSCLLRLERQAETRGALDFTARVEATPGAAEQSVSLLATTEAGPAFTVRRIDFRGLRNFGDLTLRRALVLDEGDLLDRGRLRESLSRLNRLGVLEPLTESNVRIDAEPVEHQARVTFRVRERRRGRWQLSGPVGPASLGGPLSFSVASRLPRWGAGLLETSTYIAGFQALAFSPPLYRLLGLASRGPLTGWLSFGRPYLAGQGWRSGLWWSPQLGWRATVLGYGLAQFRFGLAEPALAGSPAPPPLPVAVEWNSGVPAGTLLCEPPRPRWFWIRSAASGVLQLASSWTPALP